MLKWCLGGEMHPVPAALAESPAESPRTSLAALPPPMPPPASLPSPQDVSVRRTRSSLIKRKQAVNHVMRCVWHMARGRVFRCDYCAGCPLSQRYLVEPETDGWGALAMILSVLYVWLEQNSVETLDKEILKKLTGIVTVCLKFACGEGMRSLEFVGQEIGAEVQILGILSGQALFPWLQKVYRHKNRLQAALDREVVAVIRRVPLCSHYMQNAQARAERMLYALHAEEKQVEEFHTHALYKSLRALSTFYYACVYDDLFIVQLPERHAHAMVMAILASGEFVLTITTCTGLEVAECREVLAAVLRCAAALPMPDIFATGGLNPHDEWATAERVHKAYKMLA